jgi:hypothetical protein
MVSLHTLQDDLEYFTPQCQDGPLVRRQSVVAASAYFSQKFGRYLYFLLSGSEIIVVVQSG